MRNIISIQSKYSEFSSLLAKLGFKPESISVLGGQFKTFVIDISNPQLFLDKLFNEKAKTVLLGKLQITPSFLSVVIANTNSTDEMDLQIRIEPLNSSPKDSLYVDIVFRTVKYDVFNDFISKFGADFINEIIRSIDEIK